MSLVVLFRIPVCILVKVRFHAEQHNEMIKAVQNHTPEVIVIDEIGQFVDVHSPSIESSF